MGWSHLKKSVTDCVSVGRTYTSCSHSAGKAHSTLGGWSMIEVQLFKGHCQIDAVRNIWMWMCPCELNSVNPRISVTANIYEKQGRIHGYLSRVRVGRGYIWGHQSIWAGVIGPKTAKKSNRSPKGNRWSAIPVALLSMFVTVSDDKQGSGPEGDVVL